MSNRRTIQLLEHTTAHVPDGKKTDIKVLNFLINMSSYKRSIYNILFMKWVGMILV